MFEVEELEHASDFVLALAKLEQAGFKKYTAPAYYKEGTPENIRNIYLNNINKLS